MKGLGTTSDIKLVQGPNTSGQKVTNKSVHSKQGLALAIMVNAGLLLTVAAEKDDNRILSAISHLSTVRC